jgi:hypothetical protein
MSPNGRTLLRRFASAALIVVYSCLGLPVLGRYAAPAGGALDYPCAAHQCGCRSAEQCRTDCCCFPVEVVSCCTSARDGSEPAGVGLDAHCTGPVGDATVLARVGMQPHVHPGPMIGAPPRPLAVRVTYDRSVARGPFTDPPEKIPLIAS